MTRDIKNELLVAQAELQYLKNEYHEYLDLTMKDRIALSSVLGNLFHGKYIEFNGDVIRVDTFFYVAGEVVASEIDEDTHGEWHTGKTIQTTVDEFAKNFKIITKNAYEKRTIENKSK